MVINLSFSLLHNIIVIDGSLVVRCFVFQAEDGIRDLVRSRGLGDVYKRQTLKQCHVEAAPSVEQAVADCMKEYGPGATLAVIPVSYTHLTLPTSDLV